MSAGSDPADRGVDATSPSSATSADGPPAAGAALTLDALQAIWDQHEDLVAERIAAIERVRAALAAGRLSESARLEAEAAAHKLAGSLGLFGFARASEAARGLELELAQPDAGRAGRVSALARELRDGVTGPVRTDANG